jgi:hypothetical protein
MTEPATSAMDSTQYTEFVWRRLDEPFKLFNFELPWITWLVVLFVVLAAALVYVVWMYIKDAGSVGLAWASLLGLLRLTVYGILATVFLLPSNQTSIVTRSEGKVLVLFDVSGSMGTSDDIDQGLPNQKLTTRMDQVLEFLQDGKIDFIPGLEKKNPITAYRIGTKADEEYLHFANGGVLTRRQREEVVRDEEGNIIKPEPKPLPKEYWRAWLNPALPIPPDAGDVLSTDDQKRFEKLRDHNAKIVKDGLTRGTNLADSLISIINKELNNRVQGIVLFTDGRNTEGSGNAFTDLANRAKASRIPIFVVGVGEDRPKVKIEIVDLRLPPVIQPEDRFRTVVEITGEGLAGQKLDVTLEITHVRHYKAKTKDKSGKVVEEERDEILPIQLVEKEEKDDKKDPKDTKESRKVLEKITLGEKLILKPVTEVVLDKANPPRVEVEWQIDAATMAKVVGKDLTAVPYSGKKWVIGETNQDSELKFQVRVPVDKREPPLKDKSKFHTSDKFGMKVLNRKLRVLLFAAAANRDYQFVQSLLVREMEKDRLELAICLQPPPGETPKEGVVQSVPPERLLKTFPESFGKKKDLDDLSSYDVLICYDPDWKRLDATQVQAIKRWADKGGGIIMIGGYINTFELVRPGDDGASGSRYQPILDLLPVVLDDRRDIDSERKTDDPFALDFEGATRELEFLVLDEELDESKFKEDWQAFFYGTGKERTAKPQRGFYSFYPVQKVKSGSVVVARYTDPVARLKDNTLQPYIVITPEVMPRVVWIGSAETWRLREYREAYHERFWTKLVHYAGSRSKGAVAKTLRLEVGKVFKQFQYVPVDAKIDGPDGQPLSRDVKPTIKLKMPPGVPDTEIKQPIIMTSRPGSKDGWFSGRFQVKSPGDYEMTVTVPRQPGQDTETKETHKFTVKEANPEMDNTRPDFDRMYRMASVADEIVLPRMNEADRVVLKKHLVRPKVEAAEAPATPDQPDISDDKPRLYFDLRNAGVIPLCMIQDVQKQTSRGPHRDLWDDGVTIHEYPPPEDPAKPARQPIKVSYVLMIVVGLLSVEWLIRKLLRLA